MSGPWAALSWRDHFHSGPGACPHLPAGGEEQLWAGGSGSCRGKGLPEPWGLMVALQTGTKGHAGCSWGASGTPAREWKQSHTPGLSVARFGAFKAWKKVSLVMVLCTPGGRFREVRRGRFMRP